MATLKRGAALNDLESSSDAYIETMSQLLTMIYNKNKRNKNFNEMQQKFETYKTDAPRTIIEKGGIWIWRYRVEIKDKNEEKLMKEDFLEKYILTLDDAEKAEITKGEQYEVIKELINQLHVVWHCCNATERTKIWELMAKLLSNYARYLKAKNTLNPPVAAAAE